MSILLVYLYQKEMRKMITILSLVGLYGAYKRFGDEAHPIEVYARGLCMFIMATSPIWA